jgi:hypothetical protein
MPPRPKVHPRVQLNLFRSSPTTPDWRQLPVEVKRRTLPLLARLLHALRDTQLGDGQSQEVRDE